MARSGFRRFRKGYYVTSDVVMVLKETGERIGRIRRSRIFVYGERDGVLRGRIVRDGREVEYRDGKWICFEA